MDRSAMRLAFVSLIALLAFTAAVAEEADKSIDIVHGEIVAVDTAAKTVAVKADDSPGAEEKGERMSLKVNDETKILKDGKPIELSALRSGDAVVVNYRTDGETPVAISIGVQTKTG